MIQIIVNYIKKVNENPTEKNNKKLLKLLKTMKELEIITPELEKKYIYIQMDTRGKSKETRKPIKKAMKLD